MRPWTPLALCLLTTSAAFGQQPAAPDFSPKAADKPATTTPVSSPQGTAASAAVSAPPLPNTLLDGTPVKLRLAENLTSATAKAGQQVSFEVVEEVDVEGMPVIPKFAKALATVTDAYPKKSMGRGGKLDVNVDSVRLIDGEKVQLRAVQEAKGGGHVGAMTGAIVATSIIFFPAAPLFLFVKGKDIVIPEGTVVTAFVQGDMKLDMNKMVPPGTMTPAQGSAAVPTATLAIASNITGADIEVDGAFVGNTPSSISVTTGQHTVAVKKKGYADWTRTMAVSGDGAHIAAELEADSLSPATGAPAVTAVPTVAPQP